MAVESKPLFHPEVIRQHLRMFTMPESVAASLPNPLNQKAEAWWQQNLNGLGEALKTSFKLKTTPLKNPRIADEWEPYLHEKTAEQTRLTAAIEAAEKVLNDRVYRLFGLTEEEILLLKKEVEH